MMMMMMVATFFWSSFLFADHRAFKKLILFCSSLLALFCGHRHDAGRHAHGGRTLDVSGGNGIDTGRENRLRCRRRDASAYSRRVGLSSNGGE